MQSGLTATDKLCDLHRLLMLTQFPFIQNETLPRFLIEN